MSFGIGVLGATGFIGTPYREEIRAAPADARIVALCARRRDLLEAAGRADRAQLITDDWRQVIDHPDVNVVLICTPDALHSDAVMACVASGKHIVCEKPIGLNGREALDMWHAVRNARLGHFVPFWTRYVPVFARAREILRQGVAGQIRAVVYRWHNPRPPGMPLTWRDDATLSSAGSIADVGSHAYDTIRWILGTSATRVLAHAGVITPAKPDLGPLNLAEAIQFGQQPSAKLADTSSAPTWRRGTAFDYASVAFELEDETVGTLILSHAPFLRKGLAPEIEFHGTLASISVDRLQSTVAVVPSGSVVPQVERIDDPGSGNRFARYVFPALRDRIAGRDSVHPGMNDGCRAQLFTDAAATSAQTGGWVSLPAAPDL